MSIQCQRCGYAITEPICASCVTNEIKNWLCDQPAKKENIRKINRKLDFLLKQIEELDYAMLPSNNPWATLIMKCISCNKEMPLMCSYCVIAQASQIVKNNLRCKNASESFEESFNMEPYNYKPIKENNNNIALWQNLSA
jgi:hypothetical protein